jgi:hypothetical protein
MARIKEFTAVMRSLEFSVCGTEINLRYSNSLDMYGSKVFTATGYCIDKGISFTERDDTNILAKMIVDKAAKYADYETEDSESYRNTLSIVGVIVSRFIV